MSLYYLPNARFLDQARRMAQLEEAGTCLMCRPDKPLHTTAHWAVLTNDYPYRGAAVHLIVASREHVTALTDLDVAAFADLHRVLRWVQDTFEPAGWGLAARNGQPARSGASIAHLHLHVIVPDRDVTDGVRVKFGGTPS